MPKKNKIFSSDNEYVSPYYSRKGSKQRKKAMTATLKYKKSGLAETNSYENDETRKKQQSRKYAILMEGLPDDVADAIRREVRDETGDFNSSGDVIEAADYLARSYDGVKYFSKQELIDAMKELREKRKQDLNSDFDPFEGLELF